MATGDRSISEILQDVLRNLQEIVRSEVRLAKTEIREEVIKARSAALFMAVGALCGIFTVFFLLLAAVYALTLVVPNWAAALIVTAVLVAAAAMTMIAGIKQLKRVHPAPEKTVETMKENVAWAKQQVK
jgi:cytochrome c biogenesis protein CcdA